MAEFQEAISTYYSKDYHRNEFTYECAGCGCFVRGYAQKRVRGHVYCKDCRKKNEQMRLEKVWFSKFQQYCREHKYQVFTDDMLAYRDKSTSIQTARELIHRLQWNDFGAECLDTMYGRTQNEGFMECFELVFERLDKLLAEMEGD